MHFNIKKYRSLKSRFNLKYRKSLVLVAAELNSTHPRKISKLVLKNSHLLQEPSSINWYFLAQLKLFIFFNKQNINLGKSSFGPTEELVFDKWNSSEFAGTFLNFLNNGIPLGKASQKSLVLFDSHLVTFFKRHVLKLENVSNNYRLQTSLGETQSKLTIYRPINTSIQLQNKQIILKSPNTKDAQKISKKISTALDVINIYSLSSYERFSTFTEVIIPIKQKELVSYSHQELPGYSMINLYHRDFIDLMDDLIHENGHHHLNYYLNTSKLIIEPIDNIYFSPWRRTLRPLRGIYHAYFTFFWAFKLFADMADNLKTKKSCYNFTALEKEKIYWRAIEEHMMLAYTYEDLRRAHANGLISTSGWELISEQAKELFLFNQKVIVWKKNLNILKKEFKDLSKTLLNAKSTYDY